MDQDPVDDFVRRLPLLRYFPVLMGMRFHPHQFAIDLEEIIPLRLTNGAPVAGSQTVKSRFSEPFTGTAVANLETRHLHPTSTIWALIVCGFGKSLRNCGKDILAATRRQFPKEFAL
ncbi:hypothetical protein M7I_0738 [Glarea lozoyensis 74030]|uniref:Uncharacterized protein n=1 Tax=Glarea lozoyensis (strain ATCC 74030 / MF5533) TaxID=1104152 RepID=H0EE66_GLAL7|nr:hypothetical protein M7I_0738 [Glarea lozoyensis 74030]